MSSPQPRSQHGVRQHSISSYAHTQPLLKQQRRPQKASTETTPLSYDYQSVPIRYLPGPKKYLKPTPNGDNSTQQLPVFTAEKSDPWRLFLNDTGTFLRTIPMLPGTLIPSKVPGETPDEVSWRSKRDDSMLALMSVVQMMMMPVVIVAYLALTGLWCLICWVIGVLILKAWLCCIQGERVVVSKKLRDMKEAREEGDVERGKRPVDDGSGSRERWVFINGIMTGHTGLQNAVDRIEQIFGRPVVGVHNATTGFVGDILECLVQRCFNYPTEDVRIAYDYVHYYLADPQVKKVVLMAHSQGGIIASLVVDMCLAEIPRACLEKLEVYTFGSAASHFSNPFLDLPPHQQSSTNPSAPQLSRPSISPNLSAAVRSLNQALHKPPSDQPSQPETPSSSAPSNPINSLSQSNHPSVSPRSLRHIEHWANELDPIPRWGVLACMTNRRYEGHVFVRDASGHLFTKHYLGAMFPADAAARARLWGEKVLLDDKRVVAVDEAEKKNCGDKGAKDGGEEEIVARDDVQGGPALEGGRAAEGPEAREISWLYGYYGGGNSE